MWAGRVPVHHVVTLADHLALMPQSRIYALQQGDMEWIGWDTNTSILAATHNLIASLVGGLSQGTDVEKLMIRTPGEDDTRAVVEETSFPTIAEFSARVFTDFMYGER